MKKQKAHKNVASSKRYLISKTIYSHAYQLVLWKNKWFKLR